MKKFWLLASLVGIVNAEISVVNYADVKTTQIKPSTGKSVNGACWSEAEAAYGVPAKLLYAIAKVETKFNPKAISKPNKNGSYDIGLMQINSGWLPTLKKFNISERGLLDPCTNIMVGAWILSNNIKKLGYNWNAVGAYNANTSWKRDIYAKKVHNAIIELGYRD